MWYGEGHFQVYELYGLDFINKWRFFSPVRYLTIDIDKLYHSVFCNNKMICNKCHFNSFQKCQIEETQLFKNFTISDLNLHRLTCLATAAGILKRRTNVDESDILKLLEHGN